MKWLPHNDFRATDTVSGVQFGPNGLLASISWDGSVTVGSAHSPTAFHTLRTTTSRPLFGLTWQGSRVWYGGAENRVCIADVERATNTATFCDVCETDSAVLDLASSESVVVAATRSCVPLLDARSQGKQGTIEYGATALSTLGTLVCTVADNWSRVFDLRNYGQPLRTHALTLNQPLCCAWLDSETYAVGDKASQVAVVSQLASRSFVFRTNRVAQQPRPIYSIAKIPGLTRLATGGSDQHIYIWDYRQRQLKTRMLFPLPCIAIDCSKDDMVVALSSDEWSTTVSKFDSPSTSRVMISSI